MLAAFMFFKGVKDKQNEVQVCGFPLSTKPDVFKPSTILTKFSREDDKTFGVHSEFRLRSITRVMYLGTEHIVPRNTPRCSVKHTEIILSNGLLLNFVYIG